MRMATAPPQPLLERNSMLRWSRRSLASTLQFGSLVSAVSTFYISASMCTSLCLPMALAIRVAYECDVFAFADTIHRA